MVDLNTPSLNKKINKFLERKVAPILKRHAKTRWGHWIGLKALPNTALSNFIKSDIGKAWLGYRWSPNKFDKRFREEQLPKLFSNRLRKGNLTRVSIISDRTLKTTVKLDKSFEILFRKSLKHRDDPRYALHWYSLIVETYKFPFYALQTHGFLLRKGAGRSGLGVMRPGVNPSTSSRYLYPINIKDVVSGHRIKTLINTIYKNWNLVKTSRDFKQEIINEIRKKWAS